MAANSESDFRSARRSHPLLDPALPDLTTALTNTLIHQLAELSPGRRIEMFLPRWQDQPIEAAQNAGFTIRCEGYLMGKAL